MIRRVLLPLDGSRFAEQALPFAVGVASSQEADLELATVAVAREGSRPSAAASGVDAGDELDQQAAQYLARIEERVRGTDFEADVRSTVLPSGNVVASLVRHALEHDVDLAVLATHGRGPLQRAWIGSTADGFIRHAPCPVLLLRPGDGPAEGEVELQEFSGFSRILIPLDGSGDSEAVVPIADTLAGPSTEVLLVRSVPYSSPVGTTYLPHVVEERHEHEALVDAARRYLEGVARRLEDTGRKVAVKVVSSDRPEAKILETARQEKVGLIAMSTAGRGGVARLLLGSVADKVLRGASVPILLFREPEEE